MVVAGDFKNGLTFDMDGVVYQVIEFQHVKPGKGAAFVRAKIKNCISGGVTERTFNPTDKFENAYIVLTLKNIYDPEIPVNIYDLGLIYEINYDPAGVADIIMTLTAPNCPMADQLLADINHEVGKVAGVNKVNITLTFEPQWDKSMMSEEALLELNLL